jgi:hypothetical protein
MEQTAKWPRLAPVWLLLSACATAGSPPDPATGARPSPVPPWLQTIETGCGTSTALAVGDTLRCQPVRRNCRGGVCAPEPFARGADAAALVWSSTDQRVIQVRDGLLYAVGTGRAQVQVHRADSVGTSDFLVLEPIASLRFERPIYHIRIGDTVRIRAWAYDTAGRPVQFFGPDSYSPREGYGIRPQPARIRGATWDLVEGVSPGRVVASVSMAHRRDTAVIMIRP